MAKEKETLRGTLTKHEFAKRCQALCPIDVNIPQMKTLFDAFCQTLYSSLMNGDDVFLTDVGTFRSIDKPERQARNPFTGEPVICAPNMACKFQISPKLRSDLKNTNPETRKPKKFYQE